MSIIHRVGNKTKLLKYILPKIPKNYDIYIEPFLGSGAIAFTLKPNIAILGDSDKYLINFYNQLKMFPNEFITEIQKIRGKFEELNKNNNPNNLKLFQKSLTKLYNEIKDSEDDYILFNLTLQDLLDTK